MRWADSVETAELEVHFPAELTPHAKRLLDSLNVRAVVDHPESE